MNVAYRTMSFLLVSLSGLAFGCSGTESASAFESESDTNTAALTTACAGLDPEAVEHACLHANHGPFRALTATSLAEPPTQKIEAVHAAWNIHLAQSPCGGYEGNVLFTPAETADYALFVGTQSIPVRIFAGDVPVEFESSCQIPSADCDKLRRQDVVELTAGTTYRVQFGPTHKSPDALVILEEAHHHEE